MANKLEKVSIILDKSFLKDVSKKAFKGRSGTVNSALKFYNEMLDLQNSGGEFIYRKDGKDTVYHFIF